jgi:hypothetical protein
MIRPRSPYRGSRKHVLNWTGQPQFPSDLAACGSLAGCTVDSVSDWQPKGIAAPAEARLEVFGPSVLPEIDWRSLKTWWLRNAGGANTPNWDIAARCHIEGRPALILVEAKANVPELSTKGKPTSGTVSAKSRENHAHIGAAIGEACSALRGRFPRISIDHERHYQISNRIAFAWKLANLGVPVVLIYLGFIGDRGLRAPFRDAEHWNEELIKHLAPVCPDPILEQRIETASASFRILSRARPIMEISPPPSAKE